MESNVGPAGKKARPKKGKTMTQERHAQHPASPKHSLTDRNSRVNLAAWDQEFDYTKVYLEAYITEPEPKIWIGWCSECDIPVVEGKMVVSTFHYQCDIDQWRHPLERIEVAHEKCLMGKITR